MNRGRRPVSVVCVFNDEKVRSSCLDRSIEELGRQGPEIDYVPVDNVDGAFATAGAALNHGVSLARHDVVAFVHQDVYLHSSDALQRAAGWLSAGDIGLLGAIGIDATGRPLGRVRDRVILLGERLQQPADVDSLDEVLFMARRDLLRRHPLSESPDLAWHAYAVEYGLRVRSLGLRVAAGDIPLTHNSMTTNLARLDVAHRAVAELYPDRLPVRTTCGVVGAAPRRLPGDRLLRPHRWRYRWLRESLVVQRLRFATGASRWVLGDIRLDVDDLLAMTPAPPLLVVSFTGTADFVEPTGKPLDLLRGGVPVRLSSGGHDRLLEAAREAPGGASVLLTNLGADMLRRLLPAVAQDPSIAGWDHSIGGWLLLGPAARAVPQRWTVRRSRPARVPALTAS